MRLISATVTAALVSMFIGHFSDTSQTVVGFDFDRCSWPANVSCLRPPSSFTIRPERSKNGSTTWDNVRAGRPSREATTFTLYGVAENRQILLFVWSQIKPSICSRSHARFKWSNVIVDSPSDAHSVTCLQNARQFVVCPLIFGRVVAALLRERPNEDISLGVSRPSLIHLRNKTRIAKSAASDHAVVEAGNIHRLYIAIA